MSNFKPSTSLFAGKTVYKLTLLSLTPNAVEGKPDKWRCGCECGNIVTRCAHGLKFGNVQSCGCTKHVAGRKRKHHGMSGIPEYSVWNTMRQRCTNPKDAHFSYYGGRGITVCDRWVDSFADFIADVGRRPTDVHTIERRDNNLGYCPENCYWATRIEQLRNRRTARLMTYDGRTQTARAWALETGVNTRTIYHRMNRGLTPEQILTNPSRGRGKKMLLV